MRLGLSAFEDCGLMGTGRKKWWRRAAQTLRGSEPSLEAEARDGFPEQETKQRRGQVAALDSLRGRGRGGWAFFWRWGHGEQLCAGCWKRGRLGPARECGEKQ